MKLNKKIILFTMLIGVLSLGINYTFCAPTKINAYIAANVYSEPANSYFDDENFYKCVVDAYNYTNNPHLPYTTNLSDDELNKIYNLNCDSIDNIQNVKGIEKLNNLINVELYLDNETYLDFSNNINIESIIIYGGYKGVPLFGLDVSENKKLKKLSLYGSQLEELDVTNNPALTYLNVYGNEITELDVSKNTLLTNLYANGTKLTSLDVSKNVNLIELGISNTSISHIDLTYNTKLEKLDVYTAKLTELDVSNNKLLTYLDANNNQISSLDVSNNPLLTKLVISTNNLSSLNINNLTNLTYLAVGGNQLTELNVNQNLELEYLAVSSNQIKKLDLTNNTKLTNLIAGYNKLTELNVSNNTKLKQLEAGQNQLAELDVSNNIELTELQVQSNLLTSLDVSKNTELTWLDVGKNQLTELDTINNTKITHLSVYTNQLTELDVSTQNKLQQLTAGQNKLTELNVSNNVKLTSLSVYDNQLKELDVSKNIELTWLSVYGNQLKKIDVSNNTKLTSLQVQNNKLKELDVSNNEKLSILHIMNNPYSEALFIYKGDKITINNNVKIPSHLNWPSPILTSDDTNIAEVDTNGLVNTKSSGIVNITGVVSNKYTTTNTINVVEIMSNKYKIDETKNYIYIGSEEDEQTIKDNINVSDENVMLNLNLEDNKLYVEYNGEILKEFKLVSISSETYDLNKDYIYIGTNSLNKDKVNVINGTSDIKDNKLQIKHEEDVLQEYELIRVSSDRLTILDNNKVYVSNKTHDNIVDSLVVTNGKPSILNNKIIITNDNITYGELQMLSIDLGILNETNKIIVISEPVPYNTFISNINLDTELNYKILKNNIEIKEGNIEKNMVLKIYYGNIEVDTFDIIDEYLYFDESIYVDEDNKYIPNISLKSKVNDIISKINTNGSIKIIDNKDKELTDNDLIGTGSKITIKLSTKTYEYTVYIYGDIDGDGKLNLSDIMKIANFNYKNKDSLNGVYLKAADYDQNGQYNLQDVMKSAKALYGGQ